MSHRIIEIKVEPGSSADKFIKKSIKRKRLIKEYIEDGKDLKELEKFGIKFSQPI